jgi:tetratricopeptide (TPR) repeat protein
MSHSSWLAGIVVLVALPATVCACLWDHDTLQQERSRFPGTLELITGKFLRHSPEFYYWRIRDREGRLAAGATDAGLSDDLGVAYEMTGQHTKALAVLAAKEKLHPGLYETYSNLGTFHILAGDFEAGLPLIDKALAINPDAHFGREKYQKWLVEYALTRRKEGKLTLPLRTTVNFRYLQPGYAEFVAEKLGEKSLSLPEQQKAIKGVLGMMRFAHHDNPLLLEALADLLLSGQGNNPNEDAKHLATRVYLQASYGARAEKQQQAYRALAESALNMQTGGLTAAQLKLADVEDSFKSELADATAWSADLKRKELGWIENGQDADAEFAKLYTSEPVVAGPAGGGFWWALGSVLTAVLVVLLWLWARRS